LLGLVKVSFSAHHGDSNVEISLIQLRSNAQTQSFFGWLSCGVRSNAMWWQWSN
jgi:hypothetical protein